jgi:hypothetical protein
MRSFISLSASNAEHNVYLATVQPNDTVNKERRYRVCDSHLLLHDETTTCRAGQANCASWERVRNQRAEGSSPGPGQGGPALLRASSPSLTGSVVRW